MMDINSKKDCKELEGRILKTLGNSGFDTNRIKTKPNEFRKDDNYIFEGLCRAVLTRQANFESLDKALPSLKIDLFNYDIDKVAALPQADVKKLGQKYQSVVSARKGVIEEGLTFTPQNARVLQNIIQKHKFVWEFIKENLNDNKYDGVGKCYIHPNDEGLMKYFIEPGSEFKLHGVGLAICCEFFNNIGIDEFKPDRHTIRFFNRIDLAENDGQEETRKIGIKIAEKLGKPRRYVDSLIWNFCAKGRGEICTADNPKCHLCELRIKVPLFCPDWDGFLKAVIKKNPYKEVESMKRHGFSRNEARRELEKAELKLNEIAYSLKQVYDSALDIEE